jgi:hypothetical protein
MPSSPRELLLSTFDETGGGGPCDVSSTSNSRPLGEGLEVLTSGLSAEETAMALLALSEHAGALRLVWEAHARGAITLPPSVARRVVQARHAVPPFLGREASCRDVGRDIVADAATAAVVIYPQAPALGGAPLTR